MNSNRDEYRSAYLLLAALLGAVGTAACGDDSPQTANAGVSAVAPGAGGSNSGIGDSNLSEGGAAEAVESSNPSKGGAVSSATGSRQGTGGSNPSMGGASSGDVRATTSTGTQPLTNLPANAKTEIQTTAAGATLQLVSLNLVPESTPGTNYVEWFGEVKNTGSSLVCFPQIDFSFFDASGQSIWSGTAYADTKPYIESSQQTPCLASGESGAFWSNEIPAQAVRVSSVGRLSASLDGLALKASVFSHVLTVTAVEDTIYVDGNHWAMSGAFTPSQDVYNVMVTGYTKAAGGLLTGRLTATNLNSISANVAWAFNSKLGIEGARPASIAAYPEFLVSETSRMFIDASNADAAFPSRATLNTVVAERVANRQAAEARWRLAKPQTP